MNIEISNLELNGSAEVFVFRSKLDAVKIGYTKDGEISAILCILSSLGNAGPIGKELKETAMKVGQRHGKAFVFKVLAKQMYNDDFRFFISDNGVWLTDDVPVKYLKQNDE